MENPTPANQELNILAFAGGAGRAQWIVHESGEQISEDPIAALDHQKPVYWDFVVDFEVPSQEGLVLEYAAGNHARVYINGNLLARGPAASSLRLRYYDVVEIPPDILREGLNRLAIRLFHEGIGAETVQKFQFGPPGLLARLSVGGSELVVSDGSWLSRKSPEFSVLAGLCSQWGGFKEFHHAERRDEWMRPGDALDGWLQAVVAAPADDPDRAAVWARNELPPPQKSRRIPVRVVSLDPALGRLKAAGAEGPAVPSGWNADDVVDAAPGEPLGMPSVTFDFGGEIVGYPSLEIEGAGAVLEFWYGETLDLWRTDVLNFPGGQKIRWESFHRRAFRFLQIRFIGLAGPVWVSALGAESVHFPYHRDTHLETGDVAMNRILDVTRETLRANSSTHYEDCPLREQALWILDMRVMALANTYLFGNPEITAKSLRQSFSLQRADGAISATGPQENIFFFLDFMLHLGATLHEHFRFTGDADLVRVLYPALQKMDAWILRFQDTDGFLDNTRGGETCPVFFDWSTRIHRDGKTTILNALYTDYLARLAELARVAGQEAEAADFLKRSISLRERGRSVFFQEKEGLFGDALPGDAGGQVFSQQANFAALAAGWVSQEEAAEILTRIRGLGNLPRPYGPSYYLFAFAAMEVAGRTEHIREWIGDFWGAMLARGATTWWEVFDMSSPSWSYPHPFLGNTPTIERDWIPVSSCHGWSAVPGHAVPRHLLGVDFSAMHRGAIILNRTVRPVFDRVSYRVHTARGPFAANFLAEGHSYRVDVLESPCEIEFVENESQPNLSW